MYSRLLQTHAAKSAAIHQWRTSGAATIEQFIACHKYRSKRQIGIAAARQSSRLLQTRVRLLNCAGPRRVHFAPVGDSSGVVDLTGFANLDAPSFMAAGRGPSGHGEPSLLRDSDGGF